MNSALLGGEEILAVIAHEVAMFFSNMKKHGPITHSEARKEASGKPTI